MSNYLEFFTNGKQWLIRNSMNNLPKISKVLRNNFYSSILRIKKFTEEQHKINLLTYSNNNRKSHESTFNPPASLYSKKKLLPPLSLKWAAELRKN